MDAPIKFPQDTMESAPDGSQQVAGPTERRRDALAPQLDVVLHFTANIDSNDVPRISQLAGQPVELGSWERRTLKRGGVASGRARALLAECVAYQVKCHELNDLFEHGPLPPPGELRSFLDALVTTVAVGRALIEELQRDLNRLIGNGKLADAKSLSALRTKVVQCASSLEQRLGERDLDQVQQRVPWLIDEDAEVQAEVDIEVAVEHRPSEPVAAVLEEAEPEVASWASYGEAEPLREGQLPPWLSGEPVADPAAGRPAADGPEAGRRDRVKQLLMLLAVIIAMYAVVMYPRLSRPAGPPILTLKQFSHLEIVRGITARPPSLFVRLDAEGWRTSPPDARRELLVEIGNIVDGAGYSGFHARTSDGVTVGQWMKSSGVRLTAGPVDPS
jgi:hypothetical protein